MSDELAGLRAWMQETETRIMDLEAKADEIQSHGRQLRNLRDAIATQARGAKDPEIRATCDSLLLWMD